jgi:hypothetical protein
LLLSDRCRSSTDRFFKEKMEAMEEEEDDRLSDGEEALECGGVMGAGG